MISKFQVFKIAKEKNIRQSGKHNQKIRYLISTIFDYKVKYSVILNNNKRHNIVNANE